MIFFAIMISFCCPNGTSSLYAPTLIFVLFLRGGRGGGGGGGVLWFCCPNPLPCVYTLGEGTEILGFVVQIPRVYTLTN